MIFALQARVNTLPLPLRTIDVCAMLKHLCLLEDGTDLKSNVFHPLQPPLRMERDGTGWDGVGM